MNSILMMPGARYDDIHSKYDKVHVNLAQKSAKVTDTDDKFSIRDDVSFSTFKNITPRITAGGTKVKSNRILDGTPGALMSGRSGRGAARGERQSTLDKGMEAIMEEGRRVEGRKTERVKGRREEIELREDDFEG